jgi:hypothetical protein
MKINYDSQLKKIKNLKWIPWIGCNYIKSKLLVLSESHFDWKEKNSWKMLNDFEFERNHIKEHYIKVIEGNKNYISVLDNLLKAIYNKKEITSEKKLQFAKNISYGVIVHKPLKNNLTRPNKLDFINGWKINSKIIQIIKPKIIMFIGVESINYIKKNVEVIEPLRLKKYKEFNKINNVYPRKFILMNDNEIIDFIAVKHTSSRFSWVEWGKFINKNIDIKNND